MRTTTVLIAAVLLLGSAARGQVSGGRLPTRWDKDVSPTDPWPEYPRPQMVRPRWQGWNGPWDYAVTPADADGPPAAYDGKILVPFPYESALSGGGKPSIPGRRLWYRRTFAVPADWAGQRVLLHFGAVNWDAVVNLNGHRLGEHKGGYDGFDFDATDGLRPGDNERVVAVRNPLTSDTPGAQVLGKQRAHPGGVLYTAATGIWQTVRVEPVPAADPIAGVTLTPDVPAGVLRVAVDGGGAFTAAVTDAGRPVAAATGVGEVAVPIPNPHLWTPDDPHLYAVRVTAAAGDAVDCYAAMRQVSLGRDDRGRVRMLLNGRLVFQVGPLDQGYWPDGLYTAPTDAAMRSDVDVAKRLGFNLLRKHAKVEPDRWYSWADTLGVHVWQDMPQAFGDGFSDATKKQWSAEMRAMIAGRRNRPSIVVWTPFNEGWGQHDTASITDTAKRLDPTRLIGGGSGGYPQRVDGQMTRDRRPTRAVRLPAACRLGVPVAVRPAAVSDRRQPRARRATTE